MAHHRGKPQSFFSSFIYLFILFIFPFDLTSPLLSLLSYQATQITHILEGRLKGAVKEADKERVLKEVSESTLQEQTTDLATADLAATERRSIEAKRARVTAEKRVANLEGKLGEVEVKLAQAESVISIMDKEIADLKVAV